MIGIRFFNRFLMIVIILIFIVGLVGDKEALFYGLLSGIPLGAFQVITSLILISYREKMTKVLKRSLNAYYILVVFYFLLFNTLSNYPDMREFSKAVLFTMPVILAVGITIIIELIYKETKKGNLYKNEVINNIGK